MTQLGRMIAPGRTSDVYEFGRGSVVKVPRPGVPAGWAAIEAEITAAVHSDGLPTPAVRGLEVVKGRESVVFERIDGQSMWQQVRDGSRDVSSVAIELAEIQLAVHGANAPSLLLEFADRVGPKIDAAHVLSAGERNEARRILASLPRGSSLCHGDLHPGNVLMSDRGPIVIDWYDAAAGSPIADFVRSSLLIRPPRGASELLHLPESSPDVLRRLHDDYVKRVLANLDVAPGVAQCWEAVLAASRLSERAEADDSGLLALWRGRWKETASPLLDAISAIR
ncbi:MAG: aminoglycoside phosphotransferase family protein [Acidimicrobiales bacterium]